MQQAKKAPDPKQEADVAARKTWRYLRLAIIVLAIGLATGVLVAYCKSAYVDGRSGHCWLGSISAYYYTPAHAVFVGSLVALGVCLISVRGNTDLEDVLLNLAGMLAPVVAFVPTNSIPGAPKPGQPMVPADACASDLQDVTSRQLDITVNGITLVVIGAAAILLLVGLVIRSRFFGTPEDRKLSVASIVGFGLALVLFALFSYLFWGNRPRLLDDGHNWAAGLMFVFIGLNVLANGIHRWLSYRHTSKKVWFLNTYTLIALGMGVCAVVFLAILGTHPQHLLLAEASLIILFSVFWILQTIELWHGQRLELVKKLTEPPANRSDA